jgi:antitoxin (DNA-binding transcriptional repressor) of toxin-antitoxin stability system
MRTVGLKVLKNKLSEYVRMAARGETILVTDRERVVAELGPADPAHHQFMADERLADLVRTGLVTSPRSSFRLPAERHPVAPTREIIADLDEDRADR